MATRKRTAGKVSGKQIRKQLKGVKTDLANAKTQVAKGDKRLSKSLAKTTKKLTTQNTAIQTELEKLREDLNKSKGKKPTRQLSMYNLFVRKRIQQGRTFEQAVNDWKSSSKLIENPELAKKKKTRTITKTRVIVRKVKSPIVKPVVRRVKRKSTSVKTQDSLNDIMKQLSALKTSASSLEKEVSPMKSGKMSSMFMDKELSNEEVAVRLTRLYFEEIARLGFKRRLDFDSIINAYYYCLQRLHNKGKELDIMRKIVEREENKLQGEPKSHLFPLPEQ
ncbi:MAG: hypothetical protein V1776_02195 [Candidatus Diapherotrites archaeon]